MGANRARGRWGGALDGDAVLVGGHGARVPVAAISSKVMRWQAPGVGSMVQTTSATLVSGLAAIPQEIAVPGARALSVADPHFTCRAG